jgi:AAA+ superfamily predicted ATPase
MIRDGLLIKLFQAFAQQEEQMFSKTAETIIQDCLAANDHVLATQLQKILHSDSPKNRSTTKKTTLLPLPTDRRNGDALISMQESLVSEEQIFLTEQTKQQIDRLFEEHHHKRKLEKHGYSPKNKLLFWGEPGCGKSYCAAYIAHELGMPLGTVQLSAVISSYLGDTASHLQRIFDTAEKTSMVLLLDEVDSVAKQRDDPNDVGELKRIVNSLLQAMDAFHSNTSIIIAASNHQYLLDPAVWRRFDDIVHFPVPSELESKAYTNYLLNGVCVTGTLSNVIKKMKGMSFADIKRIVTETVKTAILQDQTEIVAQDIITQADLIKKQFHCAIQLPTSKNTLNK